MYIKLCTYVRDYEYVYIMHAYKVLFPVSVRRDGVLYIQVIDSRSVWTSSYQLHDDVVIACTLFEFSVCVAKFFFT